MQATTLAQAFRPCPPGDAATLDTAERSLVLDRTVLLCGAQSGRTFPHGHSLIAIDRLTPFIVSELTSTTKPIGVVLRESRLETFREIHSVGEEQAGQCGAYLRLHENVILLSRTYRIRAGGRSIMLITERFPVA